MLPLVSVIVPAFNAADTLAGTLDSVLAQSYPALEILVVDDGSSDRTPSIVSEYSRKDSRVVLIQQENGGVASARNKGLDKATGLFIAPIDSDDIWHKDKVLLQVEKLRTAGEDVALVYNWHRRIDEQDRIIAPSPSPLIEGWVLHRHLEWNFVSNGSTPLIRASALRDIRYDEQFRKNGNEGCEDYLLQLQLARRYRFACVPAFLTGYRKRGGEMSSNVARMIRSHLQMYRMLENELGPDAKIIARRRIAMLQVEMARNRLRRFKMREAAQALREGLLLAPAVATRQGWRQLQIGMQRALARRGLFLEGRSSLIGREFGEIEAFPPDPAWRPLRNRRYLRKLEQLDDEFGRRKQEGPVTGIG
jgi:glycosyltransferase involved in cell wall biosynthesis